MPLPGFVEIPVDDFGGRLTLPDFRDVALPYSPGPCDNVSDFTKGSFASRPGTITAFDLTGGSDVLHGEIFLKVDAGARYFLFLMDDGHIYSSSGGARTNLLTAPTGTTHFRIITYGNRAYILFSNGSLGQHDALSASDAEPQIWDGTNVDPLTTAPQAIGALICELLSGGTVSPGLHKIKLVEETRSGYRSISTGFANILMPSAPTTAAGILTVADYGICPNNGDTVTLGGVTYTFKDLAHFTGAPYEVAANAGAYGGSQALNALGRAIKHGAGEGTDYGTGTLENPYASAGDVAFPGGVVAVLPVVAKDSGTNGNLVDASESATGMAWDGSTVAAGHLTGGAAGTMKFNVLNIPAKSASSVTKRHLAMTAGDLETYYIAISEGDANWTVNTNSAVIDLPDEQLVNQTDTTNYSQYKHPGPSGMNGCLYHDRAVMIDGTSRAWISEPGLPHTFRTDVGYQDVYIDDGDRITNVFVQGDVLYYVKSQKLYYTQDNGGDPADWPIGTIAERGTVSIYGIDTEQIKDSTGASYQFTAMLDFRGLQLFYRGAPKHVSDPIHPDWQTQNFAYMHTASVTIDPLEKQILCFLPTGSATTPNKLFIADYTLGLDQLRWYGPWTTAGAAWRGFLRDYKNGLTAMLVYAASPLVRKFSKTAYDDNGTPIAWKHRLGYAEVARSGLNLFGGIEFKAKGGGTLNFKIVGPDAELDTGAITVNVVALAGTFTRTSGSFLTDGFFVGQTIRTTGFSNAGNNTTKVISTVTALVITVTSTAGLVNESGSGDEDITGTLLEPAPLTLTNLPNKDYIRKFQVIKERIYIEFSQDSMSARFVMNRLGIYAKPVGARLS